MNTKQDEKGKKILLIRARTLNFPLSIYFSSIRLAVVENAESKGTVTHSKQGDFVVCNCKRFHVVVLLTVLDSLNIVQTHDKIRSARCRIELFCR